jgi:hypothetical protein
MADHFAMHKSFRTFLILCAMSASACSGSTATGVGTAATSPQTATAPATATQTPAPSSTGTPRADAAGIVWLCKPDIAANPCTGDLNATVIDPTGKQTVQQAQVAKDPPVDCFYVYPTTSRQTTANADLSIDPEEKGVAIAQAALFSQVCNVYAPIYPQATIEALNSGAINLQVIDIAYEGVRAAFADYLANYNHGRGVVVIGHSQGAMMLVGLLHNEIDPKPDVRKLLVSALLMGANVTVPVGKTVGGDFASVPACGSATQTGCVVAYSSFDTTPPADAAFGRVPGLTMFNFAKSDPQQILCVNPAAPGGGSAAILPYFPTADIAKLADAPTPTPTTPYISYPAEFTAECKTDGDAGWLQITRTGPAGSTPALSGSEGPSWGLHDLDVSLAIGNLVDLVRSESAAYR